jgi:hypothetical protein
MVTAKLRPTLRRALSFHGELMRTKSRGLSKSELPVVRHQLGLTIKAMAQAVGLKLPSYYYYETRYVGEELPSWLSHKVVSLARKKNIDLSSRTLRTAADPRARQRARPGAAAARHPAHLARHSGDHARARPRGGFCRQGRTDGAQRSRVGERVPARSVMWPDQAGFRLTRDKSAALTQPAAVNATAAARRLQACGLRAMARIFPAIAAFTVIGRRRFF